MKQKKKIIYFILISFLVQQTVIAGSVLSSNGLGIPLASPDARSSGMAGMATAQSDPYSISGINPAGLSAIRTTLLSLHFCAENNTFKTVQGNAPSGYSNFDGFIFAVPVKRSMGIAIQLRPITRMNYALSLRNQMDGQSYTKSTEGRGGVNSLSFSTFWGIKEYVSVGVSGNFFFGRNNEQWKVLWDDRDNFIQTDNLFSEKHSGYGFTAGILIKPLSRLIFGGTLTPKTRMHSETDFSYGNVRENRDGEIQLPSTWSAAATAILGKAASWGIEYTEQNWNQFSMHSRTFQGMQKSYRIASGGEFFAQNDPMVSYLKKMAYRVGFSYQPFFSTDMNSNPIGEYWATVGLGLPMAFGISQIDAAFGFGKRGSLRTNAFSETLFKFVLTVTVGEKWFSRVSDGS